MPRSLVLLLRRLSSALGFPVEFGQLVYVELLMFLVRSVYRFSPRQRMMVRRVKQQRDLRIHVGCASTLFEGWINVDGIPNARADLVLDLRHPLPFESASTRFIFAEHVIEHLRRDEAIAFLKECYRILLLGGAIRLITPDLEKFARAYVTKDLSFFQVASPDMPEPVMALNLMFRRGGEHNYIFDFDDMEKVLRHAGFNEVFRTTFGKSLWPALALDNRAEHRQAESLYVEAMK